MEVTEEMREKANEERSNGSMAMAEGKRQKLLLIVILPRGGRTCVF